MNLLINNQLILILTTVIISLGGLGLLIFGLFRLIRTENITNQRMQDFVNNRDNNVSSKTVYRGLPRELSGPFFNRTVKPFFHRVIDFLSKFNPVDSTVKSAHSLTVAGNPYGMHAQGFYSIRVILLFFAIAIAFFIGYINGFSNLITILIGASIVFSALLLPKIWLDSITRQRKDELRRNLPDALDMLSVCAAAGLGFDQGLKRICEFWHTALGTEFKHVIQEMDMGVSRADALRNLSTRVEVDEISSFIAIIIQAESIGMSFSEVLASQAKQMRILRQFRAKEIANLMPAKMIIPVALFIFPALLEVIIGPLIPVVLNLFS
jgi:tight adherence protein C